MFFRTFILSYNINVHRLPWLLRRLELLLPLPNFDSGSKEKLRKTNVVSVLLFMLMFCCYLVFVLRKDYPYLPYCSRREDKEICMIYLREWCTGYTQKNGVI
jgi:hypothetical protein